MALKVGRKPLSFSAPRCKPSSVVYYTAKTFGFVGYDVFQEIKEEQIINICKILSDQIEEPVSYRIMRL
jgi:hypothetical protein